MLEHTDYILYDYLHSCVQLHRKSEIRLQQSVSLERFWQQICIRRGCDLQGQRSAYRLIMKQTKHLPIYLPGHPPLLFLPTGSRRSADLCYLNFSRIVSLHPDPDKNRCLITFDDGLVLKTGSTEMLQRNYLKAERYLKLIYSSQSSQ